MSHKQTFINQQNFTIMGTTKTTTNNTTTNNTNNVNNNTTNKNIVEIKDRNIIRVTRGEKNRYYFEVDGEPFASYNQKGEEVETNSFSLDLTTLAKQIGNKHEIFNTAFSMAGVSREGILNPQIVALCFTNSKVTITRTHKDATDLRETGIEGDTYGKNTWKSTITDITPNINQFSQQALIQMIFNPQTLTIKDVPTVPTVADLFAQMK